MIEMVDARMNDRWMLKLPKHRAERPVNSWWEAQRLALTFQRISHLLETRDEHWPRVLDVGAEEGDFPCLYSMWGADVFLVEPNPKSWPWIKATFESNEQTPAGWYVGLLGAERAGPHPEFAPDCRFEDTTMWPDCASEEEPTPEHGFHHLHEHADVDATWTLTGLCIAADWTPDLICMDIEGGELHALRGATDVLEQVRPELIVSLHPDFMRDLYGHMPEAVHDLMEGLDYRKQFICADHEQHWHYVPREKPWPWADPH